MPLKALGEPVVGGACAGCVGFAVLIRLILILKTFVNTLETYLHPYVIPLHYPSKRKKMGFR